MGTMRTAALQIHNMKYIPSKADCDAIKAAAARETGLKVGAVLLEPGYRSGPGGESMNVALVTNDPKWGDTDLADYGTWAEFRKGIDLTTDGRGIVDFYIARRFDLNHELHGNVTCYIKGGELAEVRGYDKGHPVIWAAPAT